MATPCDGVCALQGIVRLCIVRWFKHIRSYKYNIEQLQEKYDDLTNLNDEITREVDRGERNLRKCTKLTQTWLAKAESLIEDEKVKQLVDEQRRKGKDQCCFSLFHCNLCGRYKMSRRAQIKANDIVKVIESKPADKITEPVSSLDLEPLPTDEFFKSLPSRAKLLNDILSKLQDDQVHAVGVWGIGAEGKTLKYIQYEEAKNMFDEIVMVEISESPMEVIQNHIAEQLGLKMDADSVEQRAKLLYNRLVRPKERQQSRKILIILDNVWKKLDLGKLGIPDPRDNTPKFCCKLLLTSRESAVCEVMGVKKDDIIKVEPLSESEARQLFRARAGKVAYDNNGNSRYEALEKRLLNKCGGLHLDITALADVVKDKELSVWEQIARELEKPISSSSHAKFSDVRHQIYSILETSYKHVESEEKKMFFLLACLFPSGARIRVEEMMSCGIGLDLFEHVDNLIEAIEQANTWVDQLLSSSLLSKQVYKLHRTEVCVEVLDIVRESIISLTNKGRNPIMTETFPRWLSLETCQKYYAISLMPGADHSRLNELHSHNLQILILDETKPEFPATFFEGMTNLKVLVLKGMSLALEGGLPKSIGKLQRSLKTLHLEHCKLGDDIGYIGELRNLLVLSLRSSTLKELPEAIGNLCKLRLLDLSDCSIGTKPIPANLLSKLSQLEGLYMFSFRSSFLTADDDERSEHAYARIDELNNMSYLKVLELRTEYQHFHGDPQFVQNLDCFNISIGEGRWTLPSALPRERSRVLSLVGDKFLGPKLPNNCLNKFLKETDYLQLHFMEMLQHIFHDFDQHDPEFPHLQTLKILHCHGMKSISSAPFAAPNLTDLTVTDCRIMKFIFLENAQVNAQGSRDIIIFPGLKRMRLKLENMVSVAGIKCSTDSGNEVQGRETFFNTEMTFPFLEELDLQYGQFVQLWEVNRYYGSFQNLKILEIQQSEKLETLGSLSIATELIQLKKLFVKECPQLREVFSGEWEEETEVPKCGEEIFGSLECIYLINCAKLQMFLSGYQNKVVLSSLQKLIIYLCPEMKSFSSGPYETPKLDLRIWESENDSPQFGDEICKWYDLDRNRSDF